jgi:hypothetical protein
MLPSLPKACKVLEGMGLGLDFGRRPTSSPEMERLFRLQCVRFFGGAGLSREGVFDQGGWEGLLRGDPLNEGVVNDELLIAFEGAVAQHGRGARGARCWSRLLPSDGATVFTGDG